MPRQSVFDMKISQLYLLLLARAGRKGRTKDEVDGVIMWLTGYDMNDMDLDITCAEFFNNAPAYNPRAEMITGSFRGVKVEDIKDPLMKKIRQLEKLVDKLAKGEPVEE